MIQQDIDKHKDSAVPFFGGRPFLNQQCQLSISVVLPSVAVLRAETKAVESEGNSRCVSQTMLEGYANHSIDDEK